MAIVPGVLTAYAHENWVQVFGGLQSLQLISFFRIGEGGWIQSGPNRVKRDPSAAFTDLDLALDPGRSLPNQRYNLVGESFGYYEKALTVADFVFEPPNALRVRCLLTAAEYQTKADATSVVYGTGPLGVPPELYELGLYDAGGNLVAYGTFEQQLRSISPQIENFVRIRG